jgi:DNA-binding NtrC family response regulator
MSNHEENAQRVGRATALIVDDDPSGRAAIAEWVEAEGFAAVVAGTVRDAKDVIAKRVIDLVVLDLQLPDGSGIDLVQELQDRADVDVVMITGHGSIDTAIEAARGGVIDYLTKPVDVARLKRALAAARKTWKLRNEITDLRAQLRGLGRFGEMIGSSPSMQRVYDLISRVAPTTSTVLITGETGVGKELVAAMLHRSGPRAQAPFLPLNCGAIAPTLMESELFGHEKGSFTGADRQHRGIFERANGGTLFLDEVTEMPPELQVKLLRVLESGSVTRVGGDQSIEVDVRLVAATNREPAQAIKDGKLRADLHYRLSVFPIHVPPLRDRGEDVRLLAEHFLAELNLRAAPAPPKRFSDTALERLSAHTWPGNVRELKNVVERAYIMATDVLSVRSVPLDGMGVPNGASGALSIEVGTSLADAQRRLILATLSHVTGDKKRTAEILGISLKTLYTRLNQYGT